MSDDLIKLCKRLSKYAHAQLSSADLERIANRIEELEAKLAKAVEVIEWALICWDDHNKHGYSMEGDWVSDARTTLAELKGQDHDTDR